MRMVDCCILQLGERDAKSLFLRTFCPVVVTIPADRWYLSLNRIIIAKYAFEMHFLGACEDGKGLEGLGLGVALGLGLG
jgi:hypothetical protein